mmetsp:Transcript_13001/g.20436  ORF Transcript_13001/g.20436 Transcript_13001/m.20436 type:complete len:264 (+) Transcript_13001:277-1068(+)
MPRSQVSPSLESTSLAPTPSTLAWRPLLSMVAPSWSPSPRVEDSSSPERPLTTTRTRPLSLVPLPVPSTSGLLPSSTESLSSSTPTIARRPGCLGSTASWRRTRSTSRSMESPSSPPTCWISPRSPSRRTLLSARITLSASPSATCSSRWSSVLPEERRMALTTLTSTLPAFTPSLRRFGTPTRSSPRSLTASSPLPLPSETCTECTPLETLTSSLSSSTTPRSTSRRSSELTRPSPSSSFSTVALAPPSRISATLSRGVLSR